MTSDNIIDVNENNFESEVLAYSSQIPVVVDFWAEWCAPCRVLGPVLEQLAVESKGGFRLARVDIDSNTNLSNKYLVRSIPTVKAFREGRVVSEFVGAIPEPRIREFILAIAPNPSDLEIGRANSLFRRGDFQKAQNIYQEVLASTPKQPGATLGLVKTSILQGQIDKAESLIKTFPASREYTSAEAILPLIQALQRVKSENIQSDENVLNAAYSQSLRLILRGNYEAAMDGLIDIIRQDKRYRNEEPRHVLVAIFEIYGDEHPLTQQYRKELASVLF